MQSLLHNGVWLVAAESAFKLIRKLSLSTQSHNRLINITNTVYKKYFHMNFATPLNHFTYTINKIHPANSIIYLEIIYINGSETKNLFSVVFLFFCHLCWSIYNAINEDKFTRNIFDHTR